MSGYRKSLADLRAGKADEEGDFAAQEQAERETSRAAASMTLDSVAATRAAQQNSAARRGVFNGDGAQFTGPATVRVSESADKLKSLNSANYLKARREQLSNKYNALRDSAYESSGLGATQAAAAAKAGKAVPQRLLKNKTAMNLINMGKTKAAQTASSLDALRNATI